MNRFADPLFTQPRRRTSGARQSAKLACTFALAATTALGQVLPTVTIVRDDQGVPHISATTKTGAYYGLGYATAEDRLFQMQFWRLYMRGELAGIFLEADYPKAKEHDRVARVLGYKHYVHDLVTRPTFDQPTLDLLTAYAEGVTDKIAEYVSAQQPWPFMFQALGETSMDPWTAEDCILVWMAATRFSNESPSWSDPLYDPTEPSNVQFKPDPGGAVLTAMGNQLLCKALRLLGLPTPDPTRQVTPAPYMKASHNLAISGQATATGRPYLLGKPQWRVSNPSILYEFAIKVENAADPNDEFDFRGAGLAGCPAPHHGWNRYFAWTLSGMGGDISDVYKVVFDNAQKTLYTVTDPSTGLGVQHAVIDFGAETIFVKGGTDETVHHRRTRWGPLLDEAQGLPFPPPTPPAGSSYVLRTTVLEDSKLDYHSVTASLRMMQAHNRTQVVDAAKLWRSPGAHMLLAFPDDVNGGPNGEIGYRSAIVIPLRPPLTPGLGMPWGVEVLDGNKTTSDWQGDVP